MQDLKYSEIRDNILKKLKEKGPMRCVELSNILSKPYTTIFHHMRALKIAGKVEKFSKATGHRGKQYMFYKISDNNGENK